jgi:hypothetical protein
MAQTPFPKSMAAFASIESGILFNERRTSI